jgi:hypothetical protein
LSDKSRKRHKSTDREKSTEMEVISTKRSKILSTNESSPEQQELKSEKDFQSVLDEVDILLNSPNDCDHHKDDKDDNLTNDNLKYGDDWNQDVIDIVKDVDDLTND